MSESVEEIKRNKETLRRLMPDVSITSNDLDFLRKKLQEFIQKSNDRKAG
jgi:hypothetical protein